MKKSVKILSVASAAALMMSVLPMEASAAEPKGKVRVIVENNTLSTADGADWEGILVDSWVDIDSDSDAISAFVDALSENGYTQSGADFGFVSEINGLGSENGGAWMATLDDWFTDEGLSAYTADSGKLENGDEIRFMYTMNWGADLGYDWQSTDTSLADITFSEGTLSPEFDSSVTEYTLELPEDVETISVYPTVSSKSFRAKIYKNDYTADQLGTDYKKGEEIAISDSDVIIVGVANSAWMSYIPDGVTETVYKIAVNHTVEEESIAEPSETEQSKPADDKMSVTADELRNAYNTFSKSAVYGNEWNMITLARFDLMTEELKSEYIASVKQYLEELGSAKVSNTRSTAVSGLVASLTSLGVDVSDFYGYNLLEPLADMDYVNQQGVNGAFYALIAFDSHDYDIPLVGDGVNQTTREKLVTLILENQGTDGGWTFDTGSHSDADMTAMALQALAPYYNTNADVKSAVDNALNFLSENQKENGGFVSYGSQDSESCSQVITALCSLHINILEDERFIKNGNTIYDAFLSYYHADDKGFAHLADGESNAISTSQAYLAAAALYRYQNGKTTVYDMTDIAFSAKNESGTESSREQSKDSSNNAVLESSVQNVSQQSNTVSEISNNNSNSNNTVSTGDTQNIVLILGAMLVSLSAAVALKRKKNKN